MNSNNPIIQSLEEQFGGNVGKILTIENFKNLEGMLLAMNSMQVLSVNESLGNYTIMVQNLVVNEQYLYRIRRVPEAPNFRLYRLSLQNRRNWVGLPIKFIRDKGILLNQMWELFNQTT